ncbi:MAG: alpha/beta fold hydrolase [Pseudomonadota bacterium]
MHIPSKTPQCGLLVGTLLILAACSTAPNSSSEPYAADPVTIDTAHPPALKELHFDSAGQRLNGILYQANGPGPHPTVVLLHGFPGNEKNLDLAQALRRAGMNVLFFHYRGAWGSEGDFRFAHVIEDVGSALTMLRSRATELRVDPQNLLLIGHSMGGFAALHGAARDANVRCTAGMAAGDMGAMATDADSARARRFAAYADTLQMLAGLDSTAELADLSANADRYALGSLAPALGGKSVLLVAAEQDEAVPPEPVHRLMVAAYEANPAIELTHRILPGDHSFSWTRGQLIRTVVTWADQCTQ